MSDPAAQQRPIIFSAPMVRAILAGQKTQTRRLVTPAPQDAVDGAGQPLAVTLDHHQGEPWPRVAIGLCITRQAVRYAVGMRLWVRETCRAEELEDGLDGVRFLADDAFIPIANTRRASECWGDLFHYRGRGKGRIGNPVPSIHMPRWASRLTLQVEAVRIERLQAITEQDAFAEGVEAAGWTPDRSPRLAFRTLWEALHGPAAWHRNPHVAVLTFAALPPATTLASPRMEGA